MARNELSISSGPLLGVAREMDYRERMWGEQHRESGTEPGTYGLLHDLAKQHCDAAEQRGGATWTDILKEEVYGVFAEDDPDALVKKLNGVAAVCATWINDLHGQKVVEYVKSLPDLESGTEFEEGEA